MNSGKILIVGGDGKIGKTVFEHLAVNGHEVYKTTRRESKKCGNALFYDGSPGSIENIAAEQPTTIVWSIGVSGYALCQDKREESFWANVTTIQELLSTIPEPDNFIYFSSTAVFDSASGTYLTDSHTSPASEYGRQKESAEQTVQSETDNYSILRLGKVLTPCWPLLSNWKQSVEDHSQIQAFSNLYLSPVFAQSIAKFIESILDHGRGEIYHCSHHKSISYLEFAHAVVEKCGGDPAIVQATLCEPEKMTDGGAGNVDIIPSQAYLDYHTVPMNLPLEQWVA